MTEQEWLETTWDCDQMLGALKGIPSDRKLRLLAVACGNTLRPQAVDARSSKVLDVLERHADVLTSIEEMSSAAKNAWDAASRWECNIANPEFFSYLNSNSQTCEEWVAQGEIHEGIARAGQIGLTKNAVDDIAFVMSCCRLPPQPCAILRDIFGNPFRPITIDPRWLTSTVVDLASVVYQERAFDRMPILADALMDAGCDNEEIITHCRGEGPHVRGCWVVDLLLGKE